MSQPGTLTVIMGPMYAGKTTHLIELFQKAKEEHVNTICFKPSLDNRYGGGEAIHSHNDQSVEATTFEHDHPETLLELLPKNVAHVVIDEIQFCDQGIIPVIDQLLAKGINVTVAGLDLDSDGNDFGPTLALAERADNVMPLMAVCEVCGAPATRTKATKPKTNTVVVGARDMYIAVCEDCF